MLRFILLLILFYLIYYLIKNIVAGYKGYSKARKQKKNGDVSIDYYPGKKKKRNKNNDDVGEYVDYEEVDD